MTVYMLRDNRTGRYYCRKHESWNRWVEQKKASIWTSRGGPAAAMANMRRDKQYCEVIPFELKEISK